jgi:hypothetical protein
MSGHGHGHDYDHDHDHDYDHGHGLHGHPSGDKVLLGLPLLGGPVASLGGDTHSAQADREHLLEVGLAGDGLFDAVRTGAPPRPGRAWRSSA